MVEQSHVPDSTGGKHQPLSGNSRSPGLALKVQMSDGVVRIELDRAENRVWEKMDQLGLIDTVAVLQAEIGLGTPPLYGVEVNLIGTAVYLHTT
ncbi:hypothetical protein ASF03_12970 [Rhizobium sp. Leaf68]|nr:hypothetical protein ASE62_12290 [Rhizobium sp. Leaf202]KQN84171.1 hypothetical protein ASF03_12970 [Rhizobium sp. Leaf68]